MARLRHEKGVRSWTAELTFPRLGDIDIQTLSPVRTAALRENAAEP